MVYETCWSYRRGYVVNSSFRFRVPGGIFLEAESVVSRDEEVWEEREQQEKLHDRRQLVED